VDRFVAFLFTDGSCKRNGDGGWAFVAVIDGEIHEEQWGNEQSTTNNRMELAAILKAMVWAHTECVDNVIIVTDSQYCINMLTDMNYTPKANKALVNIGRAILIQRPMKFEWVKGHSGNPFNERADALCNFAAKRLSQANFKFPPIPDSCKPEKVLKQA
jgi:ribonuclease HI